MLTGNLLRASRGLLGINQTEMATSVGLSVSAIQRLESSGHEVVRCSAARAQQIEDALRAAGVSILNGDGYGVQFDRQALGNGSR
jgi:transcriptional regulator with XRE-family HTH domain